MTGAGGGALASGTAGTATELRPEVERRVATLREILDRRGHQGAALSTRRNFAWLTAGGESHIVQASETGIATLVVTRHEVAAITQNIEASRLAEEELAGLGIETVAVPWWEPDAIRAEVRRRSAGGSPADDAELEADLAPVRSVLSALDQARFDELGAAAAAAVEAALEEAAPGMTELDLGAALSARLPAARTPVVLVAADERIGRYRHPLPKAVVIRQRAMAVLVAERWGLHVALTRFLEWEPLSAGVAAAFEAAREVERAIHEATRPGATLGEVFAAGEAAYAAVGAAGAWRDHHQGGTIGYQPRERIAAPGDPTVVTPGMAFAWNPSLPGAKVEDTFILGTGGERRIVSRAG